MNASHRADIISKIQKTLKKHFKPAAPPSDRSLFEHLLYACCLENASFEAADESFAKLQQLFFDWNEVRVTTVAELAETMSALPDAMDAAARLKKTLQGVFEAHYTYDLEPLKKQNIGKTQQDLGKYHGVSQFTIEYVTQHALGGHSIPLNKGVLDAFVVLEVVSPGEAQKRHVPGLERTIPKNKGVEFASLLHQLGVEFAIVPYSAKLRGLLSEIDPAAKDRLPKRLSKKEEEAKKQAANAAFKRRRAEEALRQINAPKEHKESKESKEAREQKQAKAAKEARDQKDSKHPKAKDDLSIRGKKDRRVNSPGPTKETSHAAEGKKSSTTKRLAKKKPR